MSSRTPKTSEIASLSRDEWEDLCAGICTEVYQASRVEDHLGRGNGMDGWRMVPTGVEGFQHRRFDDRFGRDQLNELKRNIGVAVARTPKEMGAKLIAYHICINIDLQPRHMGAIGEIELWRELEDWALVTHGVAVRLHSLTWVTTRLKQFPYLRPDLFEDLNQTLAEVRQQLAEKIDETSKINERILELVEQLAAASGVEAKLKALLVQLAREARVAFDRAQKHGMEEQFVEAIAKFEDAKRLLEMDKVDERLRGHVLLLLCGMKALTGHLAAAVADGEAALKLLTDIGDIELQRLARGNVAMALYKLQRYEEAGEIFEKLLEEYEAEANLLEVVRTLEHLTEMRCNSGEIGVAVLWAERLKTASQALVKLQGSISDLAVASLGTYANVLVAGATPQVPTEVRHAMLREAARTLRGVQKMALTVRSPMTALIATTQLAKVAWSLDEFDEADAIYQRVIAEADAMGLGKIAADSRFNRALMLGEIGRLVECEADLRDARQRYVSLGDEPSVGDVDHWIEEIRKS